MESNNQNNNNMTVSGIITTFNREAIIVDRAIQSMLSQTYSLFEIIVVDDNENDSDISNEIKHVCNKYKKVKYIKQNGNKGACAARNLGLDNANGEYIGFLDDDDIWERQKIEKQIEVFRDKGEDTGLVYCWGTIHNEDTDEYVDYFDETNFSGPVNFNRLLTEDCIGSTSNPLIRKKVFEVVGGFWEAQPARQDYEMWIRISKSFSIIGIKEKLFIHTIHNGEQISKNQHKVSKGYMNIYKRYKFDYVNNPKAELSIVRRILAYDKRINYDNILLLFRYIVLNKRCRK